MRGRHVLPAVLGVAVLAAPALALAQDRPPPFPTRDVAVTYRITGPDGQERRSTNSWLAAQQRVRFEGPVAGGPYMVLDRQSGRGFQVRPQDRRMVEVPEPVARNMLTGYDGRDYVRQGGDRVAGVECTIWRFMLGDRAVTACITPDGVVLRSQGGGEDPAMVVEAEVVTYGALDPARFEPPNFRASTPARPGRSN